MQNNISSVILSRVFIQQLSKELRFIGSLSKMHVLVTASQMHHFAIGKVLFFFSRGKSLRCFGGIDMLRYEGLQPSVPLEAPLEERPDLDL